MSRRSVPALLAAALLAAAARAQPLTTAFTYQGEVHSAGAPAAGPHDLRFRLYDAPSGGAQLGPTLCHDNVALAAGRFSLTLDFGAHFSGQQRFLEIDIRQDSGLTCASAAGFITLAPRQALTAAPNAAFALSAAAASTATSAADASALGGHPPSFFQDASNLTAGALPSARLSGAYTSTINLTNPSNALAGSGAALTALNASNIASGTLNPARLPVPLNLSGGAPQATLAASNTASGLGLYASSIGGDAFQAYAGGADKTAIVGIYTGAANGYGLYGQTGSATGAAIFGRIWSATSAASAGLFTTEGDQGTAIEAHANSPTGATRGVHAQVASPTGRAVVGVAASATGATYGAHFTTASTGGTAVYGEATATGSGPNATGGHFRSNAAFGVGVRAVAPAGVGLWAESSAQDAIQAYTNGFGKSAVAGFSNGASAVGIYGQVGGDAGVGVYGAAFGTGASQGGFFTSGSTTGMGVKALATAGSGQNFGGFFESSSTTGYGLYGRTTAATGVNHAVLGQTGSNAGTGVWGYASLNAGANKGVHGHTLSAAGHGVYSTGNLAATGTKAFRIDHPSDPANRFLSHYCAEGPEPLNIYSGTVALDGAGEAHIHLPAYFAAINARPRYSLTAVGAAMPMLHVAAEIDENALAAGAAAEPGQPIPACSFRIAGGFPGAKVSWRVEASRNDRWVRAHGAPVESDKPDHERGAYQHPELYGQPAQLTPYRAPDAD